MRGSNPTSMGLEAFVPAPSVGGGAEAALAEGIPVAVDGCAEIIGVGAASLAW